MSSKVIKFMYGLILLFVSTSLMSCQDSSSNSMNNTTSKNITEENLSVNLTNPLNFNASIASAENVTASENVTGIAKNVAPASEAGATNNTAVIAALNSKGIVTTAANLEIDNITLENMTEEVSGFENATKEKVALGLPIVSGASITIKPQEPISFKKLSGFVDKQGYDVLEQDPRHIIWIFNGSTENIAYVFDLKTKEKLWDDLLRIMLNLRYSGNEISDIDMGNALETVEFYTQQEGIYHLLNHVFNKDFDLTLSVPSSDVKEANLMILGEDCCQDALCMQKAQRYYIDGQLISECGSYLDKCCNVGSENVTAIIAAGDHQISAKSIDPNKKHTLIIEAITSSKPPHMFLLRDNERPIAYETKTSMNLTAFEELINR